MNHPFRALSRALCLVACVLAVPLAGAGQIKYPTMVVFGDSLSDTGNSFITSAAQNMTPAIPPSTSPHATYWQGRYTNGPVAVEYLWRLVTGKQSAVVAPSLGDNVAQTQTAISFAYGGSSSKADQGEPLGFKVENLQSQVLKFKDMLNGSNASKKSLYVVWSGSNDYFQQLGNTPEVVTDNVLKAVNDLYNLGARDFLVPNLANLGGTPFAGPAAEALTLVTKAHNALLKTKLAALRSQRRDIRIVEVDAFKLGETAVATGLVWASVPAVDVLSPGIGASTCLFRFQQTPHPCQNVPQPAFLPPFMFWDAMHPTTFVHGVLGTAMFTALLLQR